MSMDKWANIWISGEMDIFYFLFFLNLFIKPSSRIHMFFQMRRCDI